MLKFKDPVSGHTYKYEESSGVARRRVESILTKEEGTIKWIRSFSKDDVFYDIGANIGLYTIFAAPLVRTVIAIEPHVGNMTALLANIAANSFKNVLPFCIALNNKKAILPFNYDSLEIGSSNHQLSYTQTSTLVEWKPAFTLDYILYEADLPYPNHIKIDVDGIELLVLGGMTEIIFKKSDNLKSLLVEYNPDQSRNILDEFMDSFGFKLIDRQLTAAGKKAVAKGSNIEDIAHNRLYVR